MSRRLMSHGLFVVSLVFPLVILFNFLFEVDLHRFGNEAYLAVGLIGIPAIAGIVLTFWAIGDVLREESISNRSKALLLLSFFLLNSVAAYLYPRKKP